MKKILLIDDEEFMRTRFAHLVSRFGFEVITAAGGKEGIDLFRKHKPDAVLLDVLLPDMYGVRVYGCLKELDPAVRICFISGSEYEIFTVKGMHLDTVGILAKPIMGDDLKAVLDKINA